MKVTDKMVARFLGWELPQDFSPDCYISFARHHLGKGSTTWPTGTNLFSHEQAKAMLQHVLADVPEPQADAKLQAVLAANLTISDQLMTAARVLANPPELATDGTVRWPNEKFKG
jgi:hypothetical protein